MAAFADTSFVFATLVQQTNGEQATEWLARHTEPVWVSRLVRFEFEHGLRFETFLRRTQGHRGFPIERLPAVLAAWELEIERQTFRVVAAEWDGILDLASALSEKHGVTEGVRSLDLLHVATALQLGARDFLTFDTTQRRLAALEGLHVPMEVRSPAN